MDIIAVPAFGDGGLNETLNPRFGRCNFFTFVTVEDGEIKEVRSAPNNAANAMGGAGIQAAQTVGNHGATVAIVGFLGPNAAQSLASLNLKIYQAPNEQITVKEVINMYIKGELHELSNSNVGAHFGMGGGGGMGMGRGGGRGMGGGGGGGMNRRF